MTVRLHFTQAAVERLATPPRRAYYRDTKHPNLGLAVTAAGTKSWHYIGTVGGETRRIPLGKFPAMNVTMARERATRLAAEVVKGADPVQEKRAAKAAELTLREVLDAYLKAKTLKASTVSDYRLALGETFGDWLDRPLAELTETAVLKAYQRRGESSPARADNAARVLRALCNYARAAYRRPNGDRLFPANPTDILNEAKVRYRVARRRTAISPDQIGSWWRAVHALRSPVARDYLVFLALTGTRRTEAAMLRWEDLNFAAGTFHLRDPKNGRPVDLPLPAYAASILAERTERTGWVFPAPTGETGYLADPRKAIRRVTDLSGVGFTLHDLRRTFTSIANGLDIGVYTLKALLNHAVSTSDVTHGYDVPDMERLKVASRKIERRILSLAEALAADVVELRRTA